MLCGRVVNSKVPDFDKARWKNMDRESTKKLWPRKTTCCSSLRTTFSNSGTSTIARSTMVKPDFFLIIRSLLVKISEVGKESGTFTHAIRVGGFSSTKCKCHKGFRGMRRAEVRLNISCNLIGYHPKSLTALTLDRYRSCNRIKH